MDRVNNGLPCGSPRWMRAVDEKLQYNNKVCAESTLGVYSVSSYPSSGLNGMALIKLLERKSAVADLPVLLHRRHIAQ